MVYSYNEKIKLEKFIILVEKPKDWHFYPLISS